MAGKHLAEICKAEYPRLVKYCLWLLAELAVIAADIPEGTKLVCLSFVSSPFLPHFQAKPGINQLNKKIRFVFLVRLVYSSILSKLDCGSDRHSLCAEHTLPHPSMVRSSIDWLQHSLASGSAEVWGNLAFL